MKVEIEKESRLRAFMRQHFPPAREPETLFRKLVEALVEVEKSQILDAGCGGSPTLRSIKERAQLAIGVDRLFNQLRQNPTVRYAVCAQLDSLPFRNDCFDLVIARWVLEFLEQPLPFLTETSRVLKPGGKLAFITLNRKSWQLKLCRLKSLWAKRWWQQRLQTVYGSGGGPALPLKANKKKQLTSLLTQAGLAPVQIILTEGMPKFIISRPGALLGQCARDWELFRNFRTVLIGVCEKTEQRLGTPPGSVSDG